MSYSCVQADCIDWLWSLPANSVDLVFGRNAIGCDIRQSQVDLTLRRCAIASAVKEAIGG